MERKLLAIVAADMVGFSRLVENDEISVLSRQKEYFNEIIKPQIEKFHGKIIKTTGDGFLATFVSSLDAVESTTNIQKTINLREKGQSNDKRIWFRIGINVGDVVLDDGDIFGNSVNIASRLESIADAGDVCITNDIFQNIKNLKSFDIRHLGEQQLKNISQKVDVYKIKINNEEYNQSKENELLTEANQEIRYCSSKDNTIIGYAKVGNGPPLTKSSKFHE